MIFWILTKFILSKLYIRILTIKNLHLKTRTPTTLPKLILINKPINNLNKLHLSRFVSKLPIYSMQRKSSRLTIVLESQERDEFLAPRCRFHRDLRFHYRYPAQISCVSRYSRKTCAKDPSIPWSACVYPAFPDGSDRHTYARPLPRSWKEIAATQY